MNAQLHCDGFALPKVREGEKSSLVVRVVKAIVSGLRCRREIAQAVRQLRELNDQQLRDVGLTRDQIDSHYHSDLFTSDADFWWKNRR